MNRARKTFLAILGLTAAGIAAMIATSNRIPHGAAGTGTGVASIDSTPAAEPVHVLIASSVTKKRWLDAAATAFAAGKPVTASGRPIEIEIKGVLSGDSMQQILDGKLKPVVWSPGEESWIAQLGDRWSSAHNRPAITKPCKPTIYTPSGLAIWRPMAEALGWPDRKIGWKTIIDLAANPQGWAGYGHPEWGNLKLGYTHPQYSSAGLLFLASAIYALTGQTNGLKSDQIYEPRVAEALAAIARHTSKYGMVTTDLFDMMARHGPAYLHAVAAFEEGTVRLNLERAKDLRWPLVFVFPAEGTFWSDHPYCILDGTDWVSDQQATAAEQFVDFLLAKEQQSLAGQYLLRPLDASVPSGNLLTSANGTDANAQPETVPAFQVPDAATSAAIIDQFLTTKRKAAVMLVLDISGSMSGEPIRAATEATSAFLKRLDPHDEVGLMAFNDKIAVLSDVRPVSEVGEGLAQRVRQLVADGGTNLYGAVCAAAGKINDIKRRDTAAGENRLYGIVVLSDGDDTSGEISETRMFQTCLPSTPEADGTKVFTIAFGKDANRDLLGRMGQVSGGAMFEGDAASVDQAYLRISAEQ